jgi:hypothetical protein
MRETKQVVTSSFAKLVQEVEILVKDGYSVIHDGVAGPYHQVLGNFIVNFEREVEAKEEVDNQTEEVQNTQRRNRKGAK